MTDRGTPATKPESALSRIRKERCPEGCGKNLPVESGMHEMGLEDGEVWFDCGCPSAEQLVEELAGYLEWLRNHTVNVRVPLVYGSRDLFWYSPPVDEEGEPNGGRTLEQMIDAARAQKEEKR